MFATVEEQQTFIQGFFDNQKDNKKAMRKEIQEKKKTNKPKKEKVVRKTKNVSSTGENKKPRTKKNGDTPILNEDSQPVESLTLTDELTEESMIGTSENVNTDKQETNENHTAELDEINDTIEANSKMSVKPMIDKINTAIEVAQEITSKKPRAKKGTRTQHESVSRIVP